MLFLEKLWCDIKENKYKHMHKKKKKEKNIPTNNLIPSYPHSICETSHHRLSLVGVSEKQEERKEEEMTSVFMSP